MGGTLALESDDFVAVATIDQVPENRVVCLEVDGVALAICNVRSEFFAVENKCSHAESKFDKGRLRGHRLLCPLHGAIFDVRDGSVMSEPAFRPIKTYAVRVENGEICVQLA